MKSVNKKYLKIIASIWVSSFVLLFLVYLLVLIPQKNGIKKLEKQIVEQKNIFTQALEVGDYKNKLKMKSEIKNVKDKLDEFVNSFDNLSDLTFDIRQIAGKERIDSFSIKTQINNQNLEIPDCNYICQSRIDTTFMAGFNQFANFINSLERHKPVIFIDTFIIKSGTPQNSGNKAKVGLSVFVQKRQDT